MAHSGLQPSDFEAVSQVAAQIPQVISAVLDQGYNVAWSEADVVWLANPFERFFKWHDLVGAYDSAGMPETGGVSPAGWLLAPHARLSCSPWSLAGSQVWVHLT